MASIIFVRRNAQVNAESVPETEIFSFKTVVYCEPDTWLE
jgi:hypothetical protein